MSNNQEPQERPTYVPALELSRQMGPQGNAAVPFSDKFFSQGKTVRQQTNQRKIRVINDNEYEIVETQFFHESTTFGYPDDK